MSGSNHRWTRRRGCAGLSVERWVGVASLLALLGCSSAERDEPAAAGIDGGALDMGDPWGDAENDGDAADDSGDGHETAGQMLDLGGGDDEPPPPGSGLFDGCPQNMPAAWIFCEDFESIEDPADVALDYQEADGAFTLVEEVGASGHRSMAVRYREGEESAGRMVLSFGVSPIDHGGRPAFAPDESFTEIYWRVRVMTEHDWPDLGPGQLTRTLAFADESWAEAVVAHLRSVEGDVIMEAVPQTCVSGDEVACAGFEDEGSLETLGPIKGQVPLYSQPLSGEWHCVEGHLALNTPGADDGVLEFWIDDQRQAGRDDLDLRGSWTDYAINALVIDNYWPGGAPGPLRRWIDDVVISSEPIGCDDPLNDAIPS